MADVPDVPGVPALLTGFAVDDLVLMTADLIAEYGYGLQPAWGLYLGGAPVIIADTVTAFDFKVDWAISNYPIERGGFESFDRVDTPFMAKIQFAAGGDIEVRRALLASLEAATADENLTKYDVVTPEVIYPGVNVAHYDYNRAAARGVGLLLVDVWVQEIREQNTGGQNGREASGNAEVPGGNVQPDQPENGNLGGIT